MSIELGPFFLPERNLDRLPYLTRFAEERNLSPFTREQADLISLSSKTARITDRWLRMGIWGTTALSMAPAVITGLPSIVKWVQENPEDAFNVSLALAAFGGTVNVLNFLATGTVPDRSAKNNMRREQQLEEAKSDYEDIGCRLIELTHEEAAEAKRIASCLNVPSIQEAMERSIEARTAAFFCNYLHHAKEYALNHQLEPDAPWPLRLAVRSLSGQFGRQEDAVIGSPNGVNDTVPLLRNSQLQDL